MKKYKNEIKQLINKGLFHILGTSVINNVVMFINNIIIVKLLTKGQYGVFSYALNIVSLFELLSGLGLISGILQFCSEKREEKEKNSYYKFALITGGIFNTLLCIIIFLYAQRADLKVAQSNYYVKQLVFIPIFTYINQMILTIFRVRKENKKYSLLMNVHTIGYFIFSCLGAYLFSITGLIIGRYISYITSILIGLYMSRDFIMPIIEAKKISLIKKKEIIKYSIICCGSNSIAQLLYLLDIYMLGVLSLDSQIIASYKVATLIPNAMVFIPISIMVFIYPYFAEKNNDLKWIKEKYIKLSKIMALINATISLMLIIFAPLIIKILWGNEYLDAVVSFRILSVSYFLSSTFRVPCGNILAMLRKVNVNLIISIVSGSANIVLNIILIKRYGSIGAAVATLIVVIISSVIAFLYLIAYLNINIKKINQ